MAIRWKECYISTPPPYFIVLDFHVKTLQVKAIECHIDESRYIKNTDVVHIFEIKS